MAVVDVSSASITNQDAKPPVETPAYLWHGRLRSAVETIEVANGDSVASVYRFVRLFSSWRVDLLTLRADDIGTTTIGQFGLADIPSNGGSVNVKADGNSAANIFSTNVSLNAGAVTSSGLTFGNRDIANVKQRIFEMLGYTEDPKKWYDVVMVLSGASDGAGTVTIQCNYVDGT